MSPTLILSGVSFWLHAVFPFIGVPNKWTSKTQVLRNTCIGWEILKIEVHKSECLAGEGDLVQYVIPIIY